MSGTHNFHIYCEDLNFDVSARRPGNGYLKSCQDNALSDKHMIEFNPESLISRGGCGP